MQNETEEIKTIDLSDNDYLSTEDAFYLLELDDNVLDSLINGWGYKDTDISNIKLAFETICERYRANIKALTAFRMKEIFIPIANKKKLLALDTAKLEHQLPQDVLPIYLSCYKKGVEKFINVSSDFNINKDKYYPITYLELQEIIIEISNNLINKFKEKIT